MTMIFRLKASPVAISGQGEASMEELTFLARKVRADHVLASRLEGHGVVDHQIGCSLGMRPGSPRLGHPQSGRERYPEYKVNAVEFENLVQAAEEASCIIWARHGALTDSDLALASRLAKQEGKVADRRKVREEQIGSQVKRKGEAVRVKWPTKSHDVEIGGWGVISTRVGSGRGG